MKKFLKIFMCLFLLILVSGCNNLNYEKTIINDKEVYSIEDHKYVEVTEETNLIKIDVQNYIQKLLRLLLKTLKN